MKITKITLWSFIGLGLISFLIGSLIILSGSVLVGVAGVVIEALIIVVLAKLVAKKIILPLKEAIDIIKKIGLGDTSGSIAMGKKVNCSAAKNCNERDCPSYGIEDHCWVHSGSFAVVKHCPRAKQGEECRTCELYGVNSVLEELGSIIGGLSNYFEERENLALEIAQGNLAKNVELASENDGLGKALQTMVNSLREITGDVRQTTHSIVAGSEQLSDSSQVLADGAVKQASSLEQVSSSMTEIGSRAKVNNQNAAEVQALSNQALQEVKNGNQQMESMLDSMQKIKNTSSSVTKVIKVIDEIAFQTNLLALNAAVEAARAGKYGKGFAVVAEEVRSLASRSAQAARETNELIEQSVVEVENGGQMADQTATILEGINTSVDKVNNLVSEIAAASLEQNNNIDEINHGLATMNEVVQQNSSIAEETAAASGELKNQTVSLQVKLSRFKLAIQEGGDGFDWEKPKQNQVDAKPDLPQIENLSRGESKQTKTIVLDSQF